MKKSIVLALSILSFTSSFGQLVLESDQLQTGLHFTLYNLSDVNTDNMMPYGSGVTWDLSGTTATLAGSAHFLDMSSTPFEAQYPEANFAIMFELISAPVTYSLFNHSADELVEVANNVGTANAVSFINSRQTLVFSYLINASVSDVYQKEGQLEKTINNVYDGDGTFISNTETYSDVMRIFTDDDGNTSYNWWLMSPLVPLFIGSANGFVLWDSSTPQDVSNVAKNEVFEMFPNPATNEIKIFNKTLISSIDILNLEGALMFSTKQSIIDLSSLAPGVYIISANTASGSVQEKFVKTN